MQKPFPFFFTLISTNVYITLCNPTSCDPPLNEESQSQRFLAIKSYVQSHPFFHYYHTLIFSTQSRQPNLHPCHLKHMPTPHFQIFSSSILFFPISVLPFPFLLILLATFTHGQLSMIHLHVSLKITQHQKKSRDPPHAPPYNEKKLRAYNLEFLFSQSP